MPSRRRLCLALPIALLAAGFPSGNAAPTPDSEGFVPLFNGRDLTGWVNANCAPETWSWSTTDRVVRCTGKPTGALRTERQYENFILDLEWRHLSSGGNSGVFLWGTPIAAPGVPFLRGIEVQVLDLGFNIPGKNEWYTTHGDVFPIHGATMKPFGKHNGQRSFPSEHRTKASPEWNHYRITATNGTVRLAVNGKEVSGGEDCNYRKGYLALESEGAPVEFRNVRIREWPSSNPAPDLIAPADQGWSALFTGLDLRGWQTNTSTDVRWKVAGERLVSLPSNGPADPAAALRTTREFGNAEFLVDCQPPKSDNAPATAAAPRPAVQIRGTTVPLPNAKPGSFQRYTVRVAEGRITVSLNGSEVSSLPLPSDAPARSPLALLDPAAPCTFMNLYARDL